MVRLLAARVGDTWLWGLEPDDDAHALSVDADLLPRLRVRQFSLFRRDFGRGIVRLQPLYGFGLGLASDHPRRLERFSLSAAACGIAAREDPARASRSPTQSSSSSRRPRNECLPRRLHFLNDCLGMGLGHSLGDQTGDDSRLTDELGRPPGERWRGDCARGLTGAVVVAAMAAGATRAAMAAGTVIVGRGGCCRRGCGRGGSGRGRRRGRLMPKGANTARSAGIATKATTRPKYGSDLPAWMIGIPRGSGLRRRICRSMYRRSASVLTCLKISSSSTTMKSRAGGASMYGRRFARSSKYGR